jgi:hypothetical protein
MFALMTRANKNVGDDLIHQRGRRLFEHAAPGTPYVIGNAFKRLDEALPAAERDALRGIIVPGGPGARRDITKIYPFLEDARTRGIPVYFLGVGSRFFPGSLTHAGPILDDASAERLRTLSQHAPIGVRDYLTRRALEDCGVRAQLNGCPAWYALEQIDQRPPLPKRVERIAFTTPADLPFFMQSIALLRRVRSALPSARILIGLHHGLSFDDVAMAEAHERVLDAARELRCEHVDLSGSSDNLRAYDDCDLHIGYRVHAHIYFMSLRKPSFLLAEDSRGIGVLHALGGVGRSAWNELANLSTSRELLKRLRPELLALPDTDIAEWLDLALERELDLGFPHVETAARIIDRTFHDHMVPFIQRIVAE